MAAIPPTAMINQHGTSSSPNNSQGHRQLEFNDAMKSFKNMFPSMDRDVIEAVLRANNGLVDATIDQLLDMGAGEIDKVDSNPPSYSATNPHEPPPSYSDVFSTDQSSTNTTAAMLRPLPARPFSSWNPPLLGSLPEDFLRLTPTRSDVKSCQTPITNKKSKSSNAEKEAEQFLEDQRMAMFLQNEEFMRELRRNEDFVMSLERDRARKAAGTVLNEAVPVNRNADQGSPYSSHLAYPSTSLTERPNQAGGKNAVSGRSVKDEATGVSPLENETVGAVGGRPPSPVVGHDDAAFREKLKHMGKSTRKKFDKIARVFSRRKNTQREILIASAGAGSVSTANLLEEYEEDMDDDLINVGSGRLELMDERDEENRGFDLKSTNLKSTTQGELDGAAKSATVEPIVFFAEDNEFHLKEEP